MSEFELTPDEKRQVISQRIKNLEAQKFDLELNIRLGEAEAFRGDQGTKEAISQAKTNIEQLDKAVEELSGFLHELDPDEGDSPIPLNRAGRRAQGKDKDKETG